MPSRPRSAPISALPRPLRAPWIAAACVALAAASLLAPGAPTYDPWAWLVWGRELLALDLSTAQGPAWKPLPALLAAPLSLAGAAAPDLWLLVARAGALAGVALAARVAWRLGGGSALAAAGAAVGVALAQGYAWDAAQGASEGLLLFLGLAAWDRALAGRHRSALALGALAALVRPEVWPLLGVYALWCARRDRAVALPLAAGAAAVLALWFVPEWLASGDPLRSGARARVPNPGQPALAASPALESLRLAVGLGIAPLLACAPLSLLRGRRAAAGGAPTRGRVPTAALPFAAGVAWLLLVAAMAQGGFSGEARYALPGAALLAVAGGVGLGRLAAVARGSTGRAGGLPLRWAAGAAVAGVVVWSALTGTARVERFVADSPRLAHTAGLVGGLDDAIRAAGGRDAVLACGRPVIGAYRGPLLAWTLHVPKERVAFVAARGGMVFRSRLREDAPVAPPMSEAARTRSLTVGGWEVVRACARAS